MPKKIDPLNKKVYCSVTTMLTVTDVKAAAAFYQKAFGFGCRNVECHAKIEGMKNPLDGLRFHDLRHSTATKLLEQGTPLPVVAQILGWSASTAVRMIKRYGHIRPDAQRQALAGVATKEIQTSVHQFVHQPGRGLQSTLPN